MEPSSTGAAFAGLAAMRIDLGVISQVRPGLALRLFASSHARSPQLDYVVCLSGVRAVTLGLGDPASRGEDRRRWRHLAFICDVSDVVRSVADLAGGSVGAGHGAALD